EPLVERVDQRGHPWLEPREADHLLARLERHALALAAERAAGRAVVLQRAVGEGEEALHPAMLPDGVTSWRTWRRRRALAEGPPEELPGTPAWRWRPAAAAARPPPADRPPAGTWRWPAWGC